MSEHIQGGPSTAHADSHGHVHGHGPSNSPFPFTPAEKKEFEKDDIFAGQAVVVLMSAIFTIGLFLYTIVAWVVAG